MVVLDATIVNVALPSIQNDLGSREANLQWIVNAYTLVFGGFLLLGGRAGDLLGRKRLFLVGLVVFTCARSSTGSPSSSGMLIGFRALQGLGAALISPAALSIVSTTFTEGAERAKALGVWAAIAIGGGAVRPPPRRLAHTVLLVAVDLLRQRPRRRGRVLRRPPPRAGVEGRARAQELRRRRRGQRHRRADGARLRDREGADRRAGARRRRSASSCSRRCCSRRSS